MHVDCMTCTIMCVIAKAHLLKPNIAVVNR